MTRDGEVFLRQFIRVPATSTANPVLTNRDIHYVYSDLPSGLDAHHIHLTDARTPAPRPTWTLANCEKVPATVLIKPCSKMRS